MDLATVEWVFGLVIAFFVGVNVGLWWAHRLALHGFLFALAARGSISISTAESVAHEIRWTFPWSDLKVRWRTRKK